MTLFRHFCCRLSVVLVFTWLFAVSGASGLPPVVVRTPDGSEVNAASLGKEGKPYAVSFWASWCLPCIRELGAIADIYDEWRQHGFKLIAINTDDARTVANVLPMIRGRGWEYDFYLDENGDLRRAMGVHQLPHTFVFDSSGALIYQHTSFSEGMEYLLLDKLIESLGNE